jgi:hypothetical protein
VRFVVSVYREGVESTLGPFNLETAEATVTRLANEPQTRERFQAYVIPVPDDADVPQHARAGFDS